jgi:glucose-1-phosphate adenylyltransferase
VDGAILDKRVRIGAGSQIGCGDEQEPNLPVGLDSGLTVVGKNTSVPARTCVGRNCVIAADLGADAFSGALVRSGTTIGNAQ